MNVQHLRIALLSLIVMSGCEDNLLTQSPITSSSENDMFKIEISADTDVTTLTGTLPFEVTVTRLRDFKVRHDSRIIGSWSLHSMTADGESVNISQFPTTYDFFDDFSFTKTVTNTITYVETYTGGSWLLDESNNLKIIKQGSEENIGVSFDSQDIIVSMDGYMVWNYTLDGQSIVEVYQKLDQVDKSQFDESISYMTVMCSGIGTIDSYTELSNEDIGVLLPYDSGSTYTFSALFTPGLGLDSDIITASLESDDYGRLVVNMPIKVRLD